MIKTCAAVIFALTACWAQSSKSVVILGARAGDAERLGAPVVNEYRARGYQIVYAEMGGAELNLHIDLTTATRRSQAQAAVSRFLQARNSEITITHCMGEPGVVDHTVADWCIAPGRTRAKKERTSANCGFARRSPTRG